MQKEGWLLPCQPLSSACFPPKRGDIQNSELFFLTLFSIKQIFPLFFYFKKET